MTVYKFEANLSDGQAVNLSDYEGEVLLIVNTATKCGFTPQLSELEELYKTYKEKGFTVLAFPCNQFANQEPGTNEEVHETCTMQYGITYPLFEKIEVNGENAHPLYQYLTDEKKGLATKGIKWNFTKFLIDRSGHVVSRYAPQTKPEKIKADIEKLL